MAAPASPPTALVTGASRGIGRAVAAELAARGWQVSAGVRRPEAAPPDAFGAGVRVVRLDVTAPDPDAIPPELQLLVNNAGVDTANLPVEAVPAEEWRRVLETNVVGLAETTRLALPALRAGAPSVVCNVTSAGLAVPVPFFAVYRASKAAVSALSETLRSEVAPLGVRVVEVLPGPIDTDMLAESATVPEAVAIDGYRALAEHMAALRPATDDQRVPPARAAAAIVDAVEAARAAPVGAVPLRHTCDPVGAAVTTAWQDTPDEEHLAAFVEVFRPAVE
jgi:NAD(P)-dependent dehydrogenase (short-subunit alcohol dehydrogenase family)